MTRSTLLLAAAAALSLAGVCPTPAAAAATATQGYRIVHYPDGQSLCLIHQDSPDTVRLGPCYTGAGYSNTWYTTPKKQIAEYYDTHTGQASGCLDVDDKRMVYVNTTCSGNYGVDNPYQTWEMSGGEIVNHFWRDHGAGCLDANSETGSDAVYMSPCYGNDYQRWNVRPPTAGGG